MRPIKFRVWDETKKEMYEAAPDDLTLSEDWEWYVAHVGDKEPVLMQFTGLLDKNGKEIYEGDILRYHNHIHPNKIHPLSRVEYSDNCQFVLEWAHGNRGSMHSVRVYPRRFEIIGNIYENPELLTPNPEKEGE